MARKESPQVLMLETLEGDPTITTDAPVEREPAQRSPTAEPFKDASPLDTDVYREMAGILSPQKGKRTVPTLIGFVSETAHTKRFVIVDVNMALLEEAWACWLRHNAGTDEEFLDNVYRITHHNVPRMFRAVAFFDLKRPQR